ncbi:hypothetical protein HPB47_027365, partial [Ixodes persulcatus]
GLTCSPQKSELLLLLQPVRSRQLPSDIALLSQGLRIPSVKNIRILGVQMIESLKASTYQITRLISRISGCHFGMKKNLVRLVRALVVSRLAYVLPFLRLGVAEKAKLDCLITKAYKRALGIPDSTSNEKLAALGLHNTVQEIIQPAHRLFQKVKALRRLLEKEEGVYYTDAARYDRDAMAAAVVDKQGKIGRSLRAAVSEEVAIALALQLQDAKIVVSDSQMAILQYARGQVSPVTLHVLGDPEKTAKVKLIWTPAHSSLPGNEEAHDAARVTSDPSIESLTGANDWSRSETSSIITSAKGRANLRRIPRWTKDTRPTATEKITNQESWGALLLCTDLKVQEQVVRLAEDAVGVQEILAAA